MHAIANKQESQLRANTPTYDDYNDDGVLTWNKINS